MLKEKSVLLVDSNYISAKECSDVIIKQGGTVLHVNDLIEASIVIINNIIDTIIINNKTHHNVNFFSKINSSLLLRTTPILISAYQKEKIQDPFVLYSSSIIDLPLSEHSLVKNIIELCDKQEIPAVEIEAKNNLVEIVCSGELTEINEFCFTVESPVKFAKNSQIEIDASLLNGFGLKRNYRYCNYTHASILSNKENKTYETLIYFMGLPEKIKQKIRQYSKKTKDR